MESGAAGGFGNVPSDACGAFIYWCISRSPEVVHFLGPSNLPGVPYRGDEWDAAVWFARLVDELKTWSPAPILVDLDGYAVTQGGVVLWATPGAKERGVRCLLA
jgi:hypothetical protein